MMIMKVIPFNQLSTSDLIVDAVYESSDDGRLSGDPISKLLSGTGNMGGFRISGRGERKNWVVLFTTGEDSDWPDTIDLNTGQFIYYGDNKSPGHELHDTHAGGNKILRFVFERLHDIEESREGIPPFLIFKKCPTQTGARSVQFKGLAVPGFSGLSATEDLVAVWKSTNGQRFQNYRSVFTILDIPVISRLWLQSLSVGASENAPMAWNEWKNKGKYSALIAQSTTTIRSSEEQMPAGQSKITMLLEVWQHFRDAPIAFESFAARIYQMTDQRVIIDEITRATIDGGRDAIGRYLLGLSNDPVYAEFSLEAKCYRPPINELKGNSVGVKEVSRLISRIRHRQFGVLVTTSIIARQAYEEVRDDKHPIIFISGGDIVEILLKNGFNSVERVKKFLRDEFNLKDN
jgi:hypothetical protein